MKKKVNISFNMMKKQNKNKCFNTSKTLKVKITCSIKNFEKIAEIDNKTAKKYITAQLHQSSCEKKTTAKARTLLHYAKL